MYFELRVFFPDREANRHNAYSRGSKKVYQFLEDFEQAYGRFRKKRGHYEGMEREYFIRSDKADFEELFQMVKPFERKLEMVMDIDQIYEESDIESADAYFFTFPKTCYFYDDVFSDGEDKEPFNSLRQLCPECFVRGIREPVYIKPNNGLRKQFAAGFAGASDELGGGLNILSDPLRDDLVQRGIAERYFRPVYTRKGERWCYCFWPDERRIPHLALLDNMDDITWKCPTCGRHIYRSTAESKGESLWNQLDIHLKFGNYPLPWRWELKREIGEILPPLNSTEDYLFRDTQEIVMSRELLSLIAERIPKAKTWVEPIYFADFDTKVGRDGRVEIIYR